jgi:hypothetical protein
MNKREDRALKDLLDKYGIDPNAKKEKRVYVDINAFQYPIGTKVLEVASGLISEITRLDENRGIILNVLNRGEGNNEIVDWQSSFESRIERGYLKII